MGWRAIEEEEEEEKEEDVFPKCVIRDYFCGYDAVVSKLYRAEWQYD
jgi:hypothetical protein